MGGQVFGAYESVSGSNSADDVSSTSWGGMASGIDFSGFNTATPVTAGVSLGYSRASFDAKGGSSSAYSNNFHVGTYGAFGAADQTIAGWGA